MNSRAVFCSFPLAEGTCVNPSLMANRLVCCGLNGAIFIDGNTVQFRTYEVAASIDYDSDHSVTRRMPCFLKWEEERIRAGDSDLQSIKPINGAISYGSALVDSRGDVFLASRIDEMNREGFQVVPLNLERKEQCACKSWTDIAVSRSGERLLSSHYVNRTITWFDSSTGKELRRSTVRGNPTAVSYLLGDHSGTIFIR